ncbi:MAG: hypothetical protein R3D98_11300 [Candidatus Krumholzibacteriia bacterium]
MTKRVHALLLLLVLAALPAVAGEFSATTWDEALALSQQHGKPILIDFFTEW